MSDPIPTLRIGTRGSALALTQAHGIQADLLRLGCLAEVIIIKTSGDLDQVRPFAQVGAPGLFVRELERALVDSRVDIAVHCYKDLPSDSPDELEVIASPAREDMRDRLLIAPGSHDPVAEFLPLREGSRVGTASARRIALVQSLRPDLECVHLRGNVPTRVKQLASSEYDAILLASAGINRLDAAAERGECPPLQRGGLIEVDLDPRSFVPAPSQGALALQVRRGDFASARWIQSLDAPADHAAVRAERHLLALVEAGCQVPFGAVALTPLDPTAGTHELVAALEVDGTMRRAQAIGDDPAELARKVYGLLLPERLG